MGDGGDGLRVGQHRVGRLGARQRRMLSLAPILSALKLFAEGVLEKNCQGGKGLVYLSFSSLTNRFLFGLGRVACSETR